ncbi:MAG: TauD/TfdA family dioxygenase [Pseudomonadales bacterium]|nr:TauD/TfdA family dioxygenase [Pseudomonadales bacterium]
MGYRFIEVDPLTPRIGATVSGVQLAEMNDDVFEEIHAAWLKHLVLFFRDQKLSHEAHLALGRRFGELHIHPAAPYEGGDPALMKIYTDANSHRNNGEGWHSDVSADECPPMASILQIHQTPSSGGDTLWASMYEAWDHLSEPMRAFLADRQALHVADYTGYYGAHSPQRESPRSLHPIARKHPETGRTALFVNSGFTKRIDGLDREESSSLLRMLFEHVKNPNFQCRFRWTPNAVAIWDNRCTQHMAVWDYYPETRHGIRVTVKGDRPVSQ